MNEASSIVTSEHSFFGDEQCKIEAEQNKNQIDISKNSSNPEGIFDTLNKEIRHVVENCKDLSYYSNSNSKISEQQQCNEQFLDSRYWCSRKNNNESDSLNIKNEKNEKKNNLNNDNNKNDNNNKKNSDFEEKILYINDEDEKKNINDDFDEEDMEEKTLEKKENDINEINSIKVNKNNLNNKNKDNINSNNHILNFKKNNTIINKSKSFTESEEQFLNEKINQNHTPNKINQSYFPCIYNNQQVHSFVSTYNNYPSTFSKGSFISTNNSSNNKFKKDEEHCSSEIEEEIRINNNISNINNDEIKNNNNSYNHGNKFGPHLNNYNQLSNNNINKINMENANLANINNINNITNFNINNNFLYNRIPKMNLNMVYYIPIQQQPISTSTNYINNNKIFQNMNNIITENNSNSLNIKHKNKEINIMQNNTNIINSINEKKPNNNSSSEEKNKNKLNNSTNKAINNNYRNNTNINYKNNAYRKNDNHNSNSNINSNINNNINNTPCNKGEKNLLNLDDILSGKDTRTTVMIRNIPIKYTDEILIEALDEFKGKYDCLYMPFDYEKKGNKGYAFINFVDPLHILYFHEKFYGKKWPLFDSSKICELNSANFQGIYEIQKHSKNYKGLKKPLFCSDQNNININNENMIIPSKYLEKLKKRFPNLKYHENNKKKIIIIDSFK